MSKTYILDIEVYTDLFFVGVKDYKEKVVYSFEVSNRKNELPNLYNFFKSFNGFLVSFNGLHYDEVVLKYVFVNYHNLISGSFITITKQIKDFSSMIFKDSADGSGNKHSQSEVAKYRNLKPNWTSIDLFCYWSVNTRKSKKTSLKSLAIQLNWDEIQELPFDPEHLFGNNDQEIEKLIHYNLKNDLGVTEALFEKMKPDIALRHYVLKEYGLACWSYDEPKIASEYLLEYYCQKTYNVNSNEPYWQYKKRIRDTRVSIDTLQYGHLLPKLEFETPAFKKVYDIFLNNKHNDLKNFIFENNDTKLVIAPSIGGIHSENDYCKIVPGDDEYIIDADIASLYPTLFENFRFLRPELVTVLDRYVEMKYDRIEAKRTKDNNKQLFLKKVLNCFSGLADSEYSWLYSPNEIKALRITGQLMQMKYIELLSKHKGIRVFFTNTDGTTCIIKKNQLSVLMAIAKEIEHIFGVEWEFTINNKMVFINTNTYISEIAEEFMVDDNLQMKNHYVHEKPKIKRKGAYFKYGKDILLGDSVNSLVIPKALEQYFTYNVSPEDYITTPEKNDLTIFDFCSSRKVDKKYNVIYNNQKIQNVNRYFFSNKGHHLMKRQKGCTTLEHMHKDCPVTILNRVNDDLNPQKYDVNYKYYINQVRQFIQKIECQQLELF